jgi:glycosyltransferase involved in cell wall biosynthesis
MNILHILHGNSFGGMEIFCIDLCNELSKTNNVTLLADLNFKKNISKDVTLIPLDISKSKNNVYFLYKLFKIIKCIGPDIIHVHKQNTLIMIKRLNLLLKIPFIVTKQDMQIKKAFFGLEHCITITDEVSNTIKSKNLYKIYNGIPYVVPKDINLNQQVFNIVTVGGLRKVKGFDILIKECSKLNFDYHLTIIGEGSERSNLEKLIEDLQLSNNVTLLGFIDNVNDYLYSSDLQIISSLSEGFSLSMIEGIFYSKILISTPVSGSTEILPNKLLVTWDKINNKINDIFINYQEYKEIFNIIKVKNKDRLTIEGCSKEYIKVYIKIAN